jgi:alpha-galactosidase
MRRWLLLWFVLCPAAINGEAVDSGANVRRPDMGPAGVALLPPMGWNSWNRFGCNVGESLIRGIADAMVASGMQRAGYQFVIIDDCWQVGRSASGAIIVDRHRFPGGMKALADYVHSRNLKFGIYTDAGSLTCQKRPGSLGHEAQDIGTYASWGVDYVKIDWCHAEGLDPQNQYRKFKDAIALAGRPMVISICDWGYMLPWKWGAAAGNLWRTTGDISDNYEAMSAIGFSQNGLESFAGPGHWNDPDMLEVGNGHMSNDEYRTHLGLWALLAAPLLAGNDVRHMDQATVELLTNAEVIAVDQDSLGLQGHRVWQEGPLEVWSKALANGSQAVGLFNRTDFDTRMTLEFEWLGKFRSAQLHDLFNHRDLGRAQGSYSANVPRHGVLMLRVEPH